MKKIERIVDMIEADESNVAMLSSGEQIAAALLFNRLGEDWLHKIMDYHRSHP